MGIFGTLSGSKFVDGSTTVTLENSYIKSTNWSEADLRKHTSVLNGDSSWVYLGDKSNFVVTVNLHKYSAPQTKFLEIYSHYQADVDFYPFSSKPIKDATGANVKFHISGMQLYWLDSPSNYDTLDITLESNTYTNLSASLA